MRNNARMAIEFSARVGRIPVYPVADGYSLPDDVAMLASNESPDPPLPAVVRAAQRALEGANRYPDPANTALKRALGNRYGVAPNRIAIGNGSCDILLAAGDALLEPGAELVYAWPSFSVYPHLAAASGARAITVPLVDEHHDLGAMAQEITAATRLVIVCNPNNPTSTALPFAEIAAFVRSVPHHVAVIVDEAYCEFNLLDDPDCTLDLLKRAPEPRPAADVLEGLRPLRAARRLRAVRQRDVPARGRRRAPAVLLQRRPRRRRRSRRSSTRTPSPSASSARSSRASRSRRGWTGSASQPAESQANFCWFDLPEEADEAAVVKGLAERGVLVRAGAALGKAGALRVTYGTPAQNVRFLDALREVL